MSAKISFRIFACAVAVLFLYVLTASVASAITLSPVKLELSGDPGETITGEIEVYNEQAEQKTFFLGSENFEPSGEDGSPKFVGGGSGLATWITTEPSITLGPNAKTLVQYRITIPEDSEPGGYFAAIFFGGQNPNVTQGGEVSVGGRLGTLILLRVRGDIKEEAGLTLFESADGSRFFSGLPISLVYRIANNGGDRIVPAGDIKVTNTFGMESISLPVNQRSGSILPNSARRFETVWQTGASPEGFFDTVQAQWSDIKFGWYTAHLRSVWGTQNEQVTGRYDFFIIPWQLLSVFSIILILFFVLLKRYNKWVIQRARTSGT